MNIGMESCGPNPRTYSKAEYDALHAEAEALRAENGRKQQTIDGMNAAHWKLVQEHAATRAELEAARGLLLEAKRLRNAVNIYPGRTACAWADSRMDERIDAFLTATSAPEVRQPLSGDISDQDWINAGCPPEVRQSVKQAQSVPGMSGIGRDADHPRALVLYLRAEPTDDDIRAVQEALRAGAAEQGERQEAQVMGRVHHNPDHAEPVRAVLNSIGRQLPDHAPLYATPRPGPDVRPLVEALEHYANCGRSGNVARVALAAHRKEPGK